MPGGQEAITRAFDDVEAEVVHTTHRGHATALAAKATADGIDVVVALGGDGTVNEVANGILGARSGDAPAELPAVAALPFGSANVFARTLGLPHNPVAAARIVASALRGRRRRVIGVGLADDRYFLFCAGLGLDAEAVRLVEDKRAGGRRASPMLYATSTIQRFFRTERREPRLRIAAADRPAIDDVFLCIVSNSAPWTYAGPIPLNPNPYANFDAGLDLFAPHRLTLPTTLALLAKLVSKGGARSPGRHVTALHDLDEFTVEAHRPIALELDGEYLGERDRVTFTSIPHALHAIA